MSKKTEHTLGQNETVDIVLAEDDPFISRMYQTKLGTSGYKVVAASNGREAANLINAHQPRLVLMDINMPELSGFEVVDMLKHDNYDFSKTTLIFLTNSTRKEDMERAKKLDGDYVVKADLTPKNVLEMIESKLKE